jgi:hypothetical protein
MVGLWWGARARRRWAAPQQRPHAVGALRVPGREKARPRPRPPAEQEARPVVGGEARQGPRGFPRVRGRVPPQGTPRAERTGPPPRTGRAGSVGRGASAWGDGAPAWRPAQTGAHARATRGSCARKPCMHACAGGRKRPPAAPHAGHREDCVQEGRRAAEREGGGRALPGPCRCAAARLPALCAAARPRPQTRWPAKPLLLGVQVLQSLVDDDLVHSEKIGISNFFW